MVCVCVCVCVGGEVGNQDLNNLIFALFKQYCSKTLRKQESFSVACSV